MNEKIPTPATPNCSHIPLPMTAWWSGFEYVFGYQIKLVQEFWGFSPDH